MKYAHPEVLVETDWVAQHAKDPGVRVIEVDVDTTAYDHGHIDGAISWNWQTQLQDSLRRTICTKAQFEALCSQSGIGPETTVILYGDNNNWFAAWAFWQLSYYGHKAVKLMNGGRKKWMLENRGLTQESPVIVPSAYKAKEPDNTIRAYRDQVLQSLSQPAKFILIDVRTVDEYSGQVIAPPGMSETAQRGGHIPGAMNIPWVQAVKEDGSFKSADELKALYQGKGVLPAKDTIVYCRIGERSSHTWFVLKCLLGYGHVKNYDGSWTEWGNLVGVPIEKTAGQSPSVGVCA